MAWGSTVPAAITALTATLRTSFGAAAVPVRDGATVSDSGKLEAVSVAYEAEDAPAVDMVSDPATHGVDYEQYIIHCAVHVLKGRDLTAARARAFALFAQAGQAIKADSRLGDSVMLAWISGYTLLTEQLRAGPTITVLFDVSCKAYTTE